jgi:hypothetical protein
MKMLGVSPPWLLTVLECEDQGSTPAQIFNCFCCKMLNSSLPSTIIELDIS